MPCMSTRANLVKLEVSLPEMRFFNDPESRTIVSSMTGEVREGYSARPLPMYGIGARQLPSFRCL